MYGIDDPTATSQMPALSAAGTPGFFTSGNPATGQPATTVTADWLNEFQSELLNVLATTNLTPQKGSLNQLAIAMTILGQTTVWSSATAELIGGYPLGAIVADPKVTGRYWSSTNGQNLTVPGATGALWTSLLGTATIEADGETGYRIGPDGIIEMWGVGTLPATPGATAVKENITFPIAFPSACFTVHVTSSGVASSAGGWPSMSVGALTQTSFQAVGECFGQYKFENNVPFFWRAIGR